MKQFIRHTMAIACLCMCGFKAQSQSYEVPVNYKLENREDYDKYATDVVATVNWLEITPINQEKVKRADANKFVMTWINGSPDIIVEVDPKFVNFLDKNPQLLNTFLGGWTRFMIENPGYMKNMVKGNLAGLRSVIKVYKANLSNGFKEDKNVEKWAKLDEKGELEDYIEKKITKH